MFFIRAMVQICSFVERWNVPFNPSFNSWTYSHHCTHKHSNDGRCIWMNQEFWLTIFSCDSQGKSNKLKFSLVSKDSNNTSNSDEYTVLHTSVYMGKTKINITNNWFWKQNKEFKEQFVTITCLLGTYGTLYYRYFNLPVLCVLPVVVSCVYAKHY